MELAGSVPTNFRNALKIIVSELLMLLFKFVASDKW